MLEFSIAEVVIILLITLSGEAVIGFFITSRLAIWWLKRKLPELIDDLLRDQELMGRIRQVLISGAFGHLGGRPPNLMNLVIGSLIQRFLGGQGLNMPSAVEKGEEIASGT
jgi:hypothetical protein